MNYKEILEHIKNNRLEKLYLFHGTEHYLLEQTLAFMKEKVIEHGLSDLNYQALDGKEMNAEQIINACETLPFMADKRIVLIKGIDAFITKKNNQEEEDQIANYLKDIPTTTCLVLVAMESVDKRKKIIKSIQKYGKIVEFNKLEGKDIQNWIAKSFRKLNKKIQEQEIHDFLEATGYLDRNSVKNLGDLDNEIKKIASYTGDRDTIHKQDIELLSVKSIESNIFSLVDSIGAKNGNKALVLLNEMLMEGEVELKILHMITRQFRILFQVKLLQAQGYTSMAIAPKLELQQFMVKKYLNQASNFKEEMLKRALEQCLVTDESIKKGTMDQRLGIELLISSFTQ